MTVKELMLVLGEFNDDDVILVQEEDGYSRKLVEIDQDPKNNYVILRVELL